MGQEGDSAGYRRRLKSNLSSLFGARCKAGSFFCTEFPGHTNCVSVFAPDGRLLFCTGKPGHTNCRRRVRPFRAESFSLNLSKGIRRLRTAGASRRPPRGGAKRKGHLRFPFLFGLLPFPWIVWRRLPTCDRCEIGERQRIFSTVGEHSVLPCPELSAVPDTILLHRRFTLRRRGISVPRNSFTRCYGQQLRV